MLWICVALTIVALGAGAAVWADNQQGFRDAGAFAELMGAVFGMASVIWLAAAVLFQREELALQRHELSLQRLEVKRLADAAEEQKRTIASQSEINRKINIANNVRNIIIAFSSNPQESFDELIWDFAKTAIDKTIVNKCSYVHCTAATDHFCAVYIDETNQENTTPEFEYYYLGRYLYGGEDSFLFRVLVDIAEGCRTAGLINWFKRELVFYMDPIKKVGRPDIYCILNAAAHYADN